MKRMITVFALVCMLSLTAGNASVLMAGEHGGTSMKEHGGHEMKGHALGTEAVETLMEAASALEGTHPELAAEVEEIAAHLKK